MKARRGWLGCEIGKIWAGYLVAIALGAMLALAGADRAVAQDLPNQDLFTAGSGGYALYRIPGLAVTPKGTLLAYAEARKSGGADWGSIDIVIRRSEDGGATWSPQRTIGRVAGPVARNPVALEKNLGAEGAVTYNNPIAVVDRRTGRIHLLFCIEYMRAFAMQSDDEGKTFSEPVEITEAFAAFRPEYNWKVIATGPGHGISLRNGRMVVPVWLSTGTGGHAHRPSVVSTIYSDDGGKIWHRGAIAVPNTHEFVNPSETVAEQLADGRVMLNVRSESHQHRRLVVTSADGANGWSSPRFQEELAEPICFGSLVRLSGAGDGRPDRLLFVNPDNLLRGGTEGKPGQGRDRRNLTVQLSEDDGATWRIKKPIETGWAGYADINVAPDGTIFCFYERGGLGDDHFRTAALTLARFDLGWLTEGKARLEVAK